MKKFLCCGGSLGLGIFYFYFFTVLVVQESNCNESLGLLHLCEKCLSVNRKPKWFSCSNRHKVFLFPVLCGTFWSSRHFKMSFSSYLHTWKFIPFCSSPSCHISAFSRINFSTNWNKNWGKKKQNQNALRYDQSEIFLCA